MAKKPKASAGATPQGSVPQGTETEAPVPPVPETTMPTPEIATAPVDGVVVSTAADETSTAEGGAQPPPTDNPRATEATTEPAAGSTPAAGDDPTPAAAPELREFAVAPERVVLHDGEPYLAGDLIRLTRDQHAPLHAGGAVAEPWAG